MAKKTTQQVRVNTTRYLDEDGLDKLWDKIKEYVKNNSINIDGEDIDLSIYATKEYVDDALANIDTSDIDLTGYTTKEELTNELLKYAKKEDLNQYATKTYVDHAVSTVDTDPGIYIGTDEPTEPSYTVWIDTDDGETAELDNYYTKAEVDALIPNVDLSTKADVVHTHSMADITDYVAPDLSNYATKSHVEYYVGDAIADALVPYALKTELPTVPDVSGFALKTEIPSLDGYAKTEDLPDMTLYALKTDIPTVPDVTVYQTEAQVNALIDAKLGVIENGTY